MSGAPVGLGLTALATLTTASAAVLTRASVGSASSASSPTSAPVGFVLAPVGDCCHLGKVLGVESRLGFVQVGSRHGGDGHLFGGQVNLVSGLKHLFVRVGCELHVTDMSPYIDR